MIDIKLIFNGQYWDIAYDSAGELSLEDGFDTAVLMSIYCEKRASESEVPESIRRRGWIGNKYWNEDGSENGSKFWIHVEKGRVTNLTLNEIKNAAQNGLNWFIEQGFLEDIETGIENIDGVPKLVATLSYSPSRIEKRYYDIWRNTGVD